MRMDWDKFGEEPQQRLARSPLSPGFHHGKIVAVNEQSGWRVTDQNPTGDCLSIWIDCDEFGEAKRVFYTVASNWTRKIIEIAACAGVAPPERGNPEWDEQQLVGADVYVETGTYIVQQGKNAGEERAKVVQFVPRDRHPRSTETTTERRARHDSNEVTNFPRRAGKPAQQERANSGEDDIPF